MSNELISGIAIGLILIISIYIIKRFFNRPKIEIEIKKEGKRFFLEIKVVNNRRNNLTIENIFIRKENSFYWSTAELQLREMPFVISEYSTTVLKLKKEWLDLPASQWIKEIKILGSENVHYPKKKIKKLTKELKHLPMAFEDEIYELTDDGLFLGFEKDCSYIIRSNQKLGVVAYGDIGG